MGSASGSMAYIPGSGGGGGGGGPVVPFDANDLFCWVVDEAAGVHTYPNRVPGGATATLTNSTPSMFPGQVSPISASELSLYNNYSFRDSAPEGASANIGPTNDMTIDWYFKPLARQNSGSPSDHWLWKKYRQADTASADNATVGFIIKYATNGPYELLNWEARVRLTSGNTCTVSPSSFGADPRIQAFALAPLHWHHLGMTVALSGANTVLKVWLDGSPVVDSDNGNETKAGTAIDWNTGFPWSLFGYLPAAPFTMRGALGWMHRLRVSNVVRPATYFRDAYLAVR